MSKHTLILNVKLSDTIQALADIYKDAVLDSLKQNINANDVQFVTSMVKLIPCVRSYESMKQACKDGYTMVLFPQISSDLDNRVKDRDAFAINVKDDNGEILWVISGNDCDW